LYNVVRILRRNHDAVLSTDIFDTLLLRNCLSEPNRFWRSSELFAKKMRALGHRIDPDLVFRARREVHSLAYRVPGLDGGTVERDYYSVFNSRTAALRFWHLFESVLEPSLPSVTTFSREWAGAEPTSNLQVRNWRDDRYWSDSPMFSSILEFIEELPSQDTASYILSEATRAWSSLAKCITFPSRIELSKIQIADRSHDFGREGKVPFISRTRPSLHSRLRSLQSSLWREGYIASSFPRSRILLLLGLEATYFIRSIWLFLTSTSGLMLSERNPTR
jgi:hypothetical protein